MKNRVTYLLLAIICAWIPMFMGAFDKDKPASSTSLRNSNPEILANWSALEDAIDQNHDFTTGGTQTGRHEAIELLEQADLGTGAVGVTIAGSQTVSGKGEFVYTDEDDNDVQVTAGGNIGGGNVELLAGKDLIGSATSDITINTNKFTVAGATGNSVIAGTLNVTGVVTTTAASVLGDGSTLAAATESGDGDRTIVDKAFAESLGVRQIASTRDVTTTSTSNTITLDDSIPQNTEGDELFTLAITPASTDSKLLIEGVVLVGTATTNRVAILSLFQDTTADAIAVFTHDFTLVGGTTAIPFSYLMAAAEHTTAATTLKLRLAISAAGTLHYNSTSTVANLFGGKEGSTMIITEIGG